MGIGLDGSLCKELALQGQGQGPRSISWAHGKGMCWLVCPCQWGVMLSLAGELLTTS